MAKLGYDVTVKNTYSIVNAYTWNKAVAKHGYIVAVSDEGIIARGNSSSYIASPYFTDEDCCFVDVDYSSSFNGFIAISNVLESITDSDDETVERGCYYTSDPLGKTWTKRHYPKNDFIPRSICINETNNKMYLFPDNSYEAIALDVGESEYTTISIPVSAKWADAKFGNGTIIAVSENSNYFLKGSVFTFELGDLPDLGTDGYVRLAYGNGVWVAIPKGQSDSVVYSTDNGDSWNVETLPTARDYTDITYTNRGFMMVGMDTNVVAMSEAGTNWSEFQYKDEKDVITEEKKTLRIVITDSNIDTEFHVICGENYYELESIVTTYYTVEYSANGAPNGSIIDENSPYTSGSIVTVKPNNYGWEHYTFQGFNTEADGSGTAYQPYETFAIIADTVLYAQWRIDPTFTVTYDGNGGDNSIADYHIYYPGDKVTVLYAPTPTREGATFIGWSTDATATVPMYKIGETFFMPYENVTLYAVWSVGYKVIYDGNGGKCEVSNGGVLWKSTLNFNKDTYNSVAFGNGIFVAVAGDDDSDVMYSHEGLNWAITQSTITKAASVCFADIEARDKIKFDGTEGHLEQYIHGELESYTNEDLSEGLLGDGAFVVFPIDSGKGSYTITAENWMDFECPQGTYYASCYGDGKVVALGSNSTRAIYSSDLKTWKESILPLSVNWRSVAYGNGVFVAVSGGMLGAISTDGCQTWKPIDLPQADGYYSITYGNGLFVAVQWDNTHGAISTDGENWELVKLANNPVGKYVAFGGDKFMVGSGTLNTSGAYSYDGRTWIEFDYPTTDIRMGCHGNERFVAFKRESNYSYYSLDNPCYYTGDVVTVQFVPTPTHDTKMFLGWSTNKTATSPVYTPTGSTTFTITDSDVTLYAVWRNKYQYTVTYNANGGSGTLTDKNSPYYEMNTVTVLSNSFTYYGYKFTGFNTAKDGSGTTYQPNSTFVINGNVTLYAQWIEIPKYTVTYDANGGTGDVIDTKSPYLEGSTVTVLPNAYERAHFTFTNWNTARNGSGTAYTENKTFKIQSNVTLYAQWSEHPRYSVKYDGNGGDSEVLDAHTYYVGDTATVKSIPTPQKKGFIFLGWSTDPAASVADIKHGDTLTMVEGGITLYAVWLEDTRAVVTYNANEGEGDVPVDSMHYEPDTEVFVKFDVLPTRKDYIFLGWSTDATAETPTYTENGTHSFIIGSVSVTLYAIWEEYVFVPTVSKSRTHLPDYLKDVRELQGICWGYDIEFARCMIELMKEEDNIFLDTMDEYSVSRWEQILKISPSGTLEDRKFNLRYRLFNRLPFTIHKCEQWLYNMTGSTSSYEIEMDYANKELKIRLNLDSDEKMRSIGEILRKMIPCNTVLSLNMNQNRHKDLKAYVHGELSAYTHYGLSFDETLRM